MRVKSPLIVLSILLSSITISSCLDSDEVNEFSSNATITSFGIDTIHGVEYKFEIDQIKNLIYNRDSLPVGSDTIIDRTLITTLTTAGMAVTSADTLFNTEDSVNLLPAMNKSGDNGMQFKVHAADGVTTRTYTLQIRVHLQDPDSLVWKDMQKEGQVFSQTATRGEQKAVILNNQLWVYTANNQAYYTSSNVGEYNWQGTTVSGLPAGALLSSILNYGNKLYALTSDTHEVYASADGRTWARVAGLGNQVKALVGEVNGQLTGIVEQDGQDYFDTFDSNSLTWSNTMRQAVPADFPSRHIYATRQTNGNGTTKTYIVGTASDNANATTPWCSEDGKLWVKLEASAAACPWMNHPFIMYYGDLFYIFGGNMDAIYSGVTGIAWYKTEKKFLLPEAFKGKTNYSIVIDPTVNANDKRDFIWVVFGGNGAPNEVWRGRLNSLGFVGNQL